MFSRPIHVTRSVSEGAFYRPRSRFGLPSKAPASGISSVCLANNVFELTRGSWLTMVAENQPIRTLLQSLNLPASPQEHR
jgi:hypothetical protein